MEKWWYEIDFVAWYDGISALLTPSVIFPELFAFTRGVWRR